MPAENLKPPIRAALRAHEIGDQSPYKLYFASKGKSGASFGFMQGDLAAGQPVVTQTFREAMGAFGIPSSATQSLLRRLSVHVIGNPLDPKERDEVNAALLASAALVDAMDEAILQKVYGDLDTCISRAHVAGREIAPAGLLLMAMWINMTGPPTKILAWLDGGDPGLSKPILPPGTTVSDSNVLTYLRATDYYQRNPQNLPHLLESLASGVKALPHDLLGAPPVAADMGLPRDCYVYEQATGRMFCREEGLNDLIATGYSGSEANGGKNNPSLQCEADIGPIPRASYTIGPPFVGPSPFSLRLTPAAGNDMCGRSGFLIHGDSIAHPGTASQGCIILKRSERERIDQNRVGPLVVVERLPTTMLIA